MSADTETDDPCWPACRADAVTYAAAVARDVERRRAAALAARFGRRIAHDANNFLTIIRTYAELIAMEVPPDSGAVGDVDEVTRAAEGLSEYLQLAVRFGRVDSAQRIGIDPVATVKDVVAQALRDGLGPIEQRLGDAGRATGDATWLAELVRGLLDNARSAAGPQSPLTVRVERVAVTAPAVLAEVPIATGHWIVCDVRDEGSGVDAGIADRIGEPFVTTRVNARGAGTTLAAAFAYAWHVGGQFALARIGDATHARLFLPTHD